jgi:hypothetical protein
MAIGKEKDKVTIQIDLFNGLSCLMQRKQKTLYYLEYGLFKHCPLVFDGPGDWL